ncbi:hypothetical protein FS842_010309 [Serendipita sp. 407]|nr:hypothetical protein FS842_010309 [Serendipita sp. 407]
MWGVLFALAAAAARFLCAEEGIWKPSHEPAADATSSVCWAIWDSESASNGGSSSSSSSSSARSIPWSDQAKGSTTTLRGSCVRFTWRRDMNVSEES